MKCVIQRVEEASVTVDQIQINRIDQGLLVYVGFHKNDAIDKIDQAVKKIIQLRIFEDEFEKMNLSIDKNKGSILLISQFTLYGNATNSNRPSFSEAMPYEQAKSYYHLFLDKLNEHIHTKSGEFGSHMKISSINDGPVTIILDL